MISSIFGKTKPINYIIVVTFLFLFYWLVQFCLSNELLKTEQILVKLGVVSILMGGVFVSNFIIQRNKITGANSFAILFFAALCLVFPETLLDSKAIVSVFFLLLAIRRILSVKSLKSIKLKVFDATLWILIASLFYNWSLLFLILVFAAIYIYEPKNIRNWLVPFVGIVAFASITYSILILANFSSFFLEQYTFSFRFNKDYFVNWGTNAKYIIYVLLKIFISVLAFLKMGASGVGKVTTMRLISYVFLLGLVIVVLSFGDGNPIIFTFFSSAIFFTNYIESIEKPKFKEVALILSILVPLLVFCSTLFLS